MKKLNEKEMLEINGGEKSPIIDAMEILTFLPDPEPRCNDTGWCILRD